MKAVIYSRVSTNDQTVDNQFQVFREVAEKKGFEVVQEISDEGISGAKGRDAREGFDELIKGASQKRVRHHSCLGCQQTRKKSSALSCHFLDDIHSAKCDLYIHQSGLDTSTASGKMMFQMIGVFSEFERSQ